MAAFQNKLYVVSGNIITKMDPAGFVVEKTYLITDLNNMSGIASVGNGDFWVSVGTKFYKVNLP